MPGLLKAWRASGCLGIPSHCTSVCSVAAGRCCAVLFCRRLLAAMQQVASRSRKLQGWNSSTGPEDSVAHRKLQVRPVAAPAF